MEVACILITHFPLKVEIQRNTVPIDLPAIVSLQARGSSVVLDSSPNITGVSKGMPLQQALSRCGDVTLIEADMPYYNEVFNRIVSSLCKHSPLVEMFDLGCAFIGLSGLESVYGAEAKCIASIVNSPHFGNSTRIGIAGSKFPAYVAASISQEGHVTRVPKDVRSFLNGVTLDFLPVSWRTRERMHKFGFHTMGHLACVGISALQAQFGTEGKIAWELSNGIDSSWLLPVEIREEVSECTVFPSPLATIHAVMPMLNVLLSKAFSNHEVIGRWVSSVSLEFGILNRGPWTKRFGFKDPIGSKEKAFPVLKNILESSRFPGPIEDMRITLSGITGESRSQSSFLADVRSTDNLRGMINQLEERLCMKPPIYKIIDLEPWSRIPERRKALVRFEL